MTPSDIQTFTIEELEKQVEHHNYLYWIENAPEISDPLFDTLVERLRELAPDSPVLDAIGPAGAGALGEDPLGFGDKIEHAVPMLSLDKAYDEETVTKWYDKFEGVALASPKIDGLACSLRYGADGALELAATRGSGVRGDVITENIKRVNDIPLQLDAATLPGALEIRGEVYMPLSVFEGFKDQYANPRNLAAGGLKQKDPENTRDYELRFFAYSLLGHDALASEIERFEYLTALGFVPVTNVPVEREEIEETFQSFVEGRYDLDYECDGVVYRANDVAEQRRMGSTGHHPRWAIAYKYQGDSGNSRVESIEWSVSRTGAINPVAIVEPVELSGATVTRASLHNLAWMSQLGITLGAEVEMMRRGGVIPHVEQVLEAGDAAIEIPTTCPCSLNAPTEQRGDQLFCTLANSGCKEVARTRVKHYVDVIECRGFGPKIIDQLVNLGLIKDAADLYTLDKTQLLTLNRMGDTLAEKLLTNLEASRALPLATFLRALGINDLGNFASKELARTFTTLDKVRAATREEIAAIHGLGELTADTIKSGLDDYTPLIERLLEHVTVEDAPVVADDDAPGGPLAGRAFLFTGALAQMKRKDAQKRVQALGGETPSGVRADLDYLVIGDADLDKFKGGWRSAKLKKAEKLQAKGSALEIIGESEFIAMLDSDDDA